MKLDVNTLILTLTSAIVGALLSIITDLGRYFIDKNKFKNQSLFDARRSVYSKAVGQVRNLWMNPIQTEFQKTNDIFGEAVLLATKDLRQKLREIAELYTQYYNSGKPMPPGEITNISKILLEKHIAVEDDMRKELGINE